MDGWDPPPLDTPSGTNFASGGSQGLVGERGRVGKGRWRHGMAHSRPGTPIFHACAILLCPHLCFVFHPPSMGILYRLPNLALAGEGVCRGVSPMFVCVVVITPSLLFFAISYNVIMCLYGSSLGNVMVFVDAMQTTCHDK